jgi:WD40 repeat protein
VDEATGEERWTNWVTDWQSRVVMSPTGKFLVVTGDQESPWTLLNVTNGKVRTCPMVEHNNPHVVVAAFTPCEQQFATGGEDGVLIIWNVGRGEAVHCMHIADGVRIASLSFSLDGTRLASGHSDGLISVWDVATGALLHTFEAHSRYVHSVQFSPIQPRLLASAGNDKRIRLWDVDSGDIIHTFDGGGFAVFSPDGHTIAVIRDGTDDCELLLIDLKSGTGKHNWIGHANTIYSASFSPDGTKIATCSGDVKMGVCIVWDSSSGARLSSIRTTNKIISVSWGRDLVQEIERKKEAFMMGYHESLGAGSRIRGLELETIRMILDQLT